MRVTSFALGAVGLSMLALTSCNSGEKTLAATRTEFFDKSGIDSSVSPGDNFFLYANGSWMKATTIPDDQSGWGSFYTLYEDNQKKLNTILQNAARSNAAKGTLEQKVGDFYTSGMDTVAIEKVGSEPLKPMLAKIDSVKDYKELMNLIAENYTTGDGDLMGFTVNADEKNSMQNIAIFYQSGLTLPEKDYYTKQDSATKAARTAFTNYATKLFTLTGVDTATAAKNAGAILTLETEIAKSHRTPAETRDPQTNYNKMAVADLQKSQPNINWPNFFAKLNVKADSVNIAQPGYFAALNTLLASQSIDVWKTKLKFDYISDNAALLTKAFRDADFEFGKTFSGQKKQSDRWKTIVNQADNG
ncbi:MAG: M13 family peptidase, partial [Chitinophagaceae bacterium]